MNYTFTIKNKLIKTTLLPSSIEFRCSTFPARNINVNLSTSMYYKIISNNLGRIKMTEFLYLSNIIFERETRNISAGGYFLVTINK